MTWGKMDDKFHRNRKVRDLRRKKGGREALGVWVFWWSWCLDDPSLDGFVPVTELSREDLRAAALLVECGLWDAEDGGYRFHDFHEYNPRREQVEAKRLADRERIASKRAASREDVARDIPATPGATLHVVASTRVPGPTRPDPTECGARDESLSTEAAIRVEYGKAWAQANAAPWPPSQATQDQLRPMAAWFEDVANRAGISVPEAISRVVGNWSRDAWAVSKRLPWKAFAGQYANFWQGRAANDSASNEPEHGEVQSW
jgi:hypothetical protein